MPPRIGPHDLTILIVAGLSLAALAIVSFLLAPVDSTPQAAGSTYSSEPNGMRAAYLVLQEIGHDVSRTVEPITALEVDPATTALILANPSEAPSKGDQQALAQFVHDGGVVVGFGVSAGAFLPGVTPTREPRRDQAIEGFAAAVPGALTRGAREISAHRVAAPVLDPPYVPLYGTMTDPAVVTGRFGDGYVIWCLDQSVVQNDGITRAGNVNLLVNAAGVPRTRRIVWDEYYHGQRRSFWSYLAGTPLVWGLAQLGLVALAMLAGSARRRGPLRPRAGEPRASPLEFIDTMASLYERAGDRSAAVRVARDRLRRRLAIVAGLPTSSSDEQIIALAAPRVGLDAGRTLAALTQAREIALRGAASEHDAVRAVAALQEALALTHG